MHISFLSRTWGYGATEEYYLKFGTPQSIESCTPRMWKSYNFNSFYNDKVISKLNYHYLLNQTALWQCQLDKVAYSNWQDLQIPMLNFRSKHFQINRVIEEERWTCSLFGPKWVLGATYLNTASRRYDYCCLRESQVGARALSLCRLQLSNNNPLIPAKQ